MRKILIVCAGLIAALFAWNTSWLAAAPADPAVRLIAHRGVHQTFDRTDLDSDTCTAERIFAPRHELLENTLASMEAAFAAGADVVELDVHPTTDGKFAVVHDWTLDCRTEGSGPVREHDMAYLRSLDIGYGYTADGGATHPFRGKGTGLMPELGEVFTAFAQRQFLVNYKSREAREGDMLNALLAAHPEWRNAVWGVYGGDAPSQRATELIADLKGFGSGQMKDCLLQYFALGWTGFVPEPCRETYVMVPANLAWALWGWPNRFAQRMRDAGSETILIGPYSAGDPGTAGLDSAADLELVPPGFDGYLWTNRIEDIGPLIKPRGRR